MVAWDRLPLLSILFDLPKAEDSAESAQTTHVSRWRAPGGPLT